MRNRANGEPPAAVSSEKRPMYIEDSFRSQAGRGNWNSAEKGASRAVSVPDLICLSHLRWDFVWQRPQHLLSRCARDRRVFFVEEPIQDTAIPYLDVTRRDCGVTVVVPHLPPGLALPEVAAIQQALLIDELLIDHAISDYMLWYYTPMALTFTRHLEPIAIIYDCMDELSAFKNAPPLLKRLEAELMEMTDVVFTGGLSLYESKRHLHQNIHPFPSSIDIEHFGQARANRIEPADQKHIPHPRLGFFGVVDERMDLNLLRDVAQARPDWHLVVIGPVVKIDPADLPQLPNIHYLGGKDYRDLPAYLSGWDVAMMPFAINESTRFISPTKTPEYLAAGVPVVSTPIRDVVRTYGEKGLVNIAHDTAEFIQSAEAYLTRNFDSKQWLTEVDQMLLSSSWDQTWGQMLQLINSSISRRDPMSKQQRLQTPLRTTTAAASTVPAALTSTAGD